MKTAILIHGCCDKEEFFDPVYPSLSNSHWFPWLQRQLTIKGIPTQTPEMPKPYSPEYKKWKPVFEQFPVTTDTILVGHSCGAGFLLRWLSENKMTINKLILVAPWLDPIEKRKGFLDFEIDENIKRRIKEVHIFYSQDETVEGVEESIKTIRNIFEKAIMHEFKDKGHFTSEDTQSNEFPELLEII